MGLVTSTRCPLNPLTCLILWLSVVLLDRSGGWCPIAVDGRGLGGAIAVDGRGLGSAVAVDIGSGGERSGLAATCRVRARTTAYLDNV